MPEDYCSRRLVDGAEGKMRQKQIISNVELSG